MNSAPVDNSCESEAKRARSGDVNPLQGLRTPCYVVYKEVAAANAERMRTRALALGVNLRPHVKTHKTLEGALLQTGGLHHRIVVSTLAEARFFAAGGFDDILYAVPITPDKLLEAAAIALQINTFHVLVDHPAQLIALQKAGPPGGVMSRPWSVVLMVDCGYGRDGVDPASEEAVALAKQVAEGPHTTLAGLYTHGGHSYDANTATEHQRISEAERDAVVAFAAKLCGISQPGDALSLAMPSLQVGVGSTPTCSKPPSELKGVTEWHPGNYLYYDLMQVKLGSCQLHDVAVRVCTRIVGQYPKRNTLLIDMGWTGISAQGKENNYGLIDGHPELEIKILKQEAAEVGSANNEPLDYSRYPIGLILRIIPWHSCAATHQHTEVHVLNAAGEPVETWRQVRGW